ncbi:uncharacterized protein LOC111324362 [Stylophora pistillata]|uniref:uncharacterized protein LOC111324362 n=1 Tax=Stylophora pistillata TaxID=50429 RepID=UPI000C0451EF|nr:uncharacterized protein LOC111324362 [Stylophora pistillata]
MAVQFVSIYPCCYCVALFTLAVFPFVGFCEDLLPYPVGLYPFNKDYETADASCYGNLRGKVQNVHLATGPFEQAETAYEFAGIGTSHVTIPQSPHLDVKTSITILVWIHQTAHAGSVIQYLNGEGDVGLYTSRTTSVSAKFADRTRKSFSSVNNGNHSINLQNKWQYIGVSYDHNTGMAILWINGKDVQKKYLGKFELSTDNDIRVGGGQGKGDSFQGQISCLQIYDRALTGVEVADVKNRCDEHSLATPVNCKTIAAPAGCGVPMTTQSETFYSPGYPKGYPYNAKCVWEIEVPSGYVISLQLRKFSLEVSYTKWPNCPDYVIVRDGINSWCDKLKALCGGAEDWNEEIVSTGNGMRVEFESSKNGSASGFMATYKATPVDEVLKEEDEEMIDFSRHYTGIVIGVACAAIFAILSIITFSHTKRRLQERRHGSLTQSGGRQISYSDNDIFQQNAPPTYDDVMRYPELYPPTPCQGSLANTPAATPRRGSPVSTPTTPRRSLDRHRSPMVIPKIGTPVGMPLFNPRPRPSSSLQSTLSVSIQRGISPLARAELTPQQSRQADHLSSDEHDDDDDDDELPPYPGITGQPTRGDYTALSMDVDSVLDQVRETLEQRRFTLRRGSNPSLSDNNSVHSRVSGTVNAQSGSLPFSGVVNNSGPLQERTEPNITPNTSLSSVDGNGYINPWISSKIPRGNRYGGILRSIESDV